MMQQYMKELEQEPFDHEEFVERLAWRTVETVNDSSTNRFNPSIIHETFLQAISDLQMLQERQMKKCEKLESACQEEESRHWQDVAAFQERNKEAALLFHDLDERINYVATKVIHLGDQLESINIPRSRAVEAQKLMHYFSEFISPGPVLLDIFTKKDELDEAADIIQKLYLISQELPSSKFDDACKKIAQKYDEIERSLIDEFVKAHRSCNVVRMKELANILSHFKNYSQCIDAFIEECQMGSMMSKDVFIEILPMTEKNYNLAKQVFSSPEHVMTKFILNMYQLKLQKHIVSTLSDKSDSGRYLRNLLDLYARTLELSNKIMGLKMGTDDTYLSKLVENMFQKYLDSYKSEELKYLKEKFEYILHQYYDSKGHQKRQLQSGGFQDLRRDLQAVIGTRANINIAQIEDYGGETFLSEDIAITILHESKAALQRCQVLSRSSELANNAMDIVKLVLPYFIEKYLEYGIELGLQAVPIPENKSQPQPIYFFDIVRQSNIIVHLIEKHFTECILPLVESTPKHGESLLIKKQLLSSLELKLENGIDRGLNAIVGWVKMFLQSEQKKTDFKPETDFIDTMSTSACIAVLQYLSSSITHIKSCLDGRNVDIVLTELGCRFHRVIYEHLQQYQYNSSGAMRAICDVNEYRKSAKEMHSPLVNDLFDTLHALCNLLLVKQENLNQVCTGDQLVALERSILLNFIQLREDYKSNRLTKRNNLVMLE